MNETDKKEVKKKAGRPRKESKVETKKSIPTKKTSKQSINKENKVQAEKKETNRKVNVAKKETKVEVKKSIPTKKTPKQSINKENKAQVEKKEEIKKENSKVLTIDKKQMALEKKYNRLAFILLVSIIAIIFLVFLSNKTFFRTEYINKNFKIEIPLFTYFISDKDNVVTFKTLRKSENIREYFDEYLSNLDNFDYYLCSNGNSFYYNDENNVVIYNIEVKKNIAIKTIKVKYDIKPSNRVCD